MYGIIPKAKTEAFAKAPPVNAFKSPRSPESVLDANDPNCEASIPGSTTCAPKRYTNNRPKVRIILSFSSVIFQTFF